MAARLLGYRILRCLDCGVWMLRDVCAGACATETVTAQAMGAGG